MSKSYLRTPQMVVGGDFRCHNCGKALAKKLVGSVYEVQFECPRCKAVINVKCNEPIPSVANDMEETK